MRRRDVLATAASAMSGCVGSPSGPSAQQTTQNSSVSSTPKTVPEQTTSEPLETITPPKSPYPRRVAVDHVEDEALREAFGVAVEVSVQDEEVTVEDTAQVELVFRTVTDSKRSLTYEQRYCSRNEFRATTGQFELFLFPAEGEWTVGDTDCPVVSHPNLDCGIPVVEEAVTVPASSSLAWRYDVLVPPRNVERGGCVVPGRYRFTRPFTGEKTTATLTFTLSITEP